MTHELKYRAGSVGLGTEGPSEPHWFCACRDWSMPARPRADRKSGNNQIEAQRSHGLHAEAHRLVDADLAENYAEGLRIARSLASK